MPGDKETSGASETVSKADFEKQVERARNLEAKLTDTERRLEAFKDIDPKETKLLREAYDDLRKQSAAGDPKKIDELVASKEKEIRQTVQKELDQLRESNSTLGKQLKELRVTDKVFALGASKFNDDVHEDFRRYIQNYCDEDKEGNIIVKDEKGNPRFAPGSTSKVMGPEEFVNWLVEAKPSWAKVQASQGAKPQGSSKNGTYTGDMTQEKFNALTDEQRGKLPFNIQMKFADGALRAARH